MYWSKYLYIASILFSITCIILFILIPGFPLFIFFFLPPIFWWSHKYQSETRYALPKCPYCRKTLLEPDEAFCAHCGRKLKANDF
jgi:hypothetical protein